MRRDKLRDPDEERRSFSGTVELRAAADGDSEKVGTLVGYAAVFNQLSVDLGGFRERIAPGAFSDSLKIDDIRALRNHDDESLLGRSTSGTLRLIEDELGLRMEIDLAPTTVGRDTAVMCRRGDMTGCSFSFVVDSEEYDYRSEPMIRTIQKFKKVYDVGPVTFPAYEGTSVSMRSFNAAVERRKALEAPAGPPPSLELAKLRQQLAERELI